MTKVGRHLLLKSSEKYVYPLTPVQQGMLLHSISAPRAEVYIQQLVCELHEALDVPHFRSAWQKVVDRHSVLRTSFHLEDPREPCQEVCHGVLLPFEELDWRAAGVEDAAQRFEAYLRDDRRRGFTLGRAPCWRMSLLRLAEHDYRLVWTSHHALLDGRSRRLVLQEVFALYEAFCRGGDLPLEPPPPFSDYVRWLAAQDDGAAEGYWKQLLEGFSVATPLPAGRSCRGWAELDEGDCHRTLELWLTEELTSALQKLAEECQVTFNTLLQGAWALLLSFYSGMEDVVFGATRACRRSSVDAAESMIGLFINTLPVRVRVPASTSLVPWLKELRSQWVALREHEHTSLAKVQAWSDVQVGKPLFESIVVFENSRLEATLQKQGKTWAGRRFHLHGITNYPLVLAGFLGPRVLVELTYDRCRFEDDAIGRMREHLHALLEGFAANPRRALGELPILSPRERQQLVVEWNNTAAAIPQDESIPRLFEAQVERTPQATALVFGKKSLTYQELNVRANRLAHSLRRLGVGPETPVAICVERSTELVVGLLGILKAGGAYVPLDPAYPKERLLFILRDTQAPVLLTQQSLLHDLPEHGARVICLDADADPLDSQEGTNPACLTTSEHLAYIMYTSGSTGTPKGVAVPHRGVVRLLFGIDYVRLDADRSILQLASAAFDASTFEIWGALLHGGRCVLFPGRVPALDALGRVLREHQIDTLWLTAALFNAVIDDSPEILTGVRQLLIGGEALSVAHVRRALAQLPTTTIINGYGPTEATTFTCCYRIPSQIPTDARSIPIGKPIANTSVYLLDASGRLVPVGVPGEIHVGGPGVARGYLNQPELTADRFVPDRFSAAPDARLYRTGDLARYLPDGNIEFLGRLDDQVKIRGFRIEPGEIEAALHRHPVVREAVVVAREERGNVGRRLVAYVVLRSEDAGAPHELRSFLAETLPEYMVPSAYVVLDELPLSANGKVDRRRLPAPSDCRLEEERAFAAPTTPTETKLAAIIAELLGRDRVGVDEDFFQLGGHSLLAMQAAARARQVLGVELPLTSLFETPTVAGLAETVAARGRPGGAAEQPSAPLPVSRGGALPLLSAQLSIWDIYRRFPKRTLLNPGQAYRLRGPLAVGALREALEALVERHEALRTTFRDVDGVPMQFAGPLGRLDLPVVDLSRLRADGRLIEAQRHFHDEARRPYDLAHDLMLRSLLLRLDAEDHVLVLIVNHIVFDAWSLGIFNRELSALYQAFSTGTRLVLPDPPIQPADFACWERRYFPGAGAQRQMEYWKKHLEGAPPPAGLPGDGPAPEPGDFRSQQDSIVVPRDLVDALRKLGREEGCTLSMVLFAALNVLVYESTGEEDILVGSPLAARTRPEVEGLIGCFRKRVILRTNMSGRPTFRQLLGRVREVATGAYLHLDVSQEIVFPERGLEHPTHWTNVPMNFNFTEGAGHSLTLAGLAMTRLERGEHYDWVDLPWRLTEQEDGVLVSLVARQGLFSRSRVRSYLDSYRDLLGRLASAPSQSLSRATSRAHSRTNKTPVEEKLVAIFAELLGHDQVGVHDDFFELGGHSLLAMQAAARARQVLGVELPLTSLFETPTVAGLAEMVAARGRSVNGEPPLRPLPLPRTGPFPLMASQLWRWECDVHRKTPGNAVSSVSRAYCLRGPLAVGALREALEALVERHEALRTTFRDVDGVPMQFIGTVGRLDLPVFDLSTLPADQRLPEAQRLFENEAIARFDLAKDLMVRPLLLRLDHEQHVLVLTFDHIIIDARSLGIVHRDLSALYEAIATGAAPALPGLPIQPADVAVWERQHLQGEVAERHLTYWKRHLQGAPPAPGLPSDGPLPLPDDFRSVRQSRVIEANLVDALRRLAREEGCTLPMTLLAALNVLIYESTGQADILVGALLAARSRPGVEGLIGLFSKRVILRTDLSGRPTFREVLGRVREVSTGAYLHLDVTQEVVFPERGFDHPAHWSNIPVFFNYIENLEHNLTLPGLTVSSLERPNNIVGAHPNLYFHILEQEHDLLLRIGARHGLYSLSKARESLDDYHALLWRLAAAPSQSLSRATSRAHSRTNQTPVEEKLVAIFAELLGRDRVGVDEDFFELGGHSLLAMQAVSRARQVLGVELPLTSLFETATVAGLAKTVAACGRPASGEPPWPPRRVPRGTASPLLSSQLSIWEMHREYPGKTMENTSRAYRLRGPLSVGALREALQALHERHEALQTAFSEVNGAPSQFVVGGGLELPLVDLSRLPEESRLAAAQRRFDDEARYRYDLASDRMLRPLLLRLADDDHVLVLVLNHIVMDGCSLGIFNRELSALYVALTTGSRLSLPPLPFQPADFACWERRHFQGEMGQRQMAYWKKQLQDAPRAPGLPGDGPEPEPGDLLSARQSLVVGRNLVDALRRLGREEGCTLPMTLLAALNVLLYESTGQEDVLVGSPLAARSRAEVEGLIGCFRKRVILRTDVSGKPTFRELLGRVREVATGAYIHLDVSQEIVFPERGFDHPAHWTNIPMSFNYMESSGHSLTFPGLAVSNLERPNRFDWFAMNLHLIEKEHDLLLRLNSRHGLYSPPKAREHLDNFHALLRRLVAAPSQPLSRATSRAHSRTNSVIVDELPLSPNVNVDREHLRAPRTPVEEKLVTIFAELLGHDHVGVHDDFFELGGHSLLAMQAVSRARQVLGVELSLTSLFETPTVAGLAEAIAARGRSGKREPPLRPLPLPRGGPFPLMASQLCRWEFEVHRKSPGIAAANVSRAYCLRGPLAVGALREALEALVERHEALRTTFRNVDGVPMQFVGTVGRPDLPVVDLSALPADQRLPEAQHLFDNEATRSFDLAEDLMLRPLLLRLDHEQYVLVLTFDHIVTDARSLDIVHRDLSALYEAISTGAAPALPKLSIQPADFAVWERQHLQGEVAERHLAYWKKHLQGALSAPGLPGDGPHPAPADLRSVRQSRVIEANLADALRRLAREEGCTLPMTLLAALNVLLYESSRQADVVVGGVLAARSRPEVEGLIGCFGKRVILRTDLSSRPAFRELLGRVREVATGAYLHLDVTQEIVFPERGFDHPVHWSNVPIHFNYLESSGRNLAFPGLSVSSVERPHNIALSQTILNFVFLEQEHDLVLRIGARYGLYSLAKAREHLDNFHALLRRLVAAPDQKLLGATRPAQS